MNFKKIIIILIYHHVEMPNYFLPIEEIIGILFKNTKKYLFYKF